MSKEDESQRSAWLSPRASLDSASCVANKKKRRTYLARKEEKAQLLDEMEVLHSRLALLKTTPPEQHAMLAQNWREIEQQRRAQRALMESATLNYTMQSAIRAQQLHLAGSQSLMTSLIMDRTSKHPEVPFAREIQLPVDQSRRQQLLRGMKEHTIREATQFMLSRRQFLDLRRASHQAEEFDLANGDFKSIHWDVVPFFGQHTVGDVYDELLFFMMNQEMSATEHLNAVTLRESDDDDFFDVAQVRLVTTMPEGSGGRLPLTIERNLVIYMQMFERSEMLDAPHALMVVQAVDSDDLFPYHTGERLRQDITAVVFITAAESDDESARSCVSMTRWASVLMHNADYVASRKGCARVNDDWRDDFDETVKRAVHEWCDLMLTTMKERMRMRKVTSHRRLGISTEDSNLTL